MLTLWRWGVDPLQILTLSAAVIALIGIVLVFVHVPKLAVVMMLLPALLSELYLFPSQYAVSVGGTSLYPSDIIYTCALLAVVPPIVQRKAPLPRPGALLVLLLAVLVSLAAVGAVTYTVNTAFNEFRGSYYSIPAALFVMTHFRRRDRLQWLLRMWMLWALVLCAIAFLHWGQYGLGSSNRMLLVNGQEVTARGLAAGSGLDIAVAAMVLLFAGPVLSISPRIRWTGLSLFLVVAVLLQHRTIWVVLMLCAVVGWRLDPALLRGRLKSVVGVGYVGILATLALIATGSTLMTSLATSLQEIFKANSTAAWRVTGWADLLRDQKDWAQWPFGRPFGAGFLRYIDRQPVTVAPHNDFIQTLLRGGVVGLLLLILVYVCCWRLLRGPRPLDIALRTVLVALVAYSVTYSLDLEQGILLGACLARAAVPAGARDDRCRNHARSPMPRQSPPLIPSGARPA